MKRALRHLALGLGVINVTAAAYFTVTDTAWVMRGRPAEEYPEALFLIIIAPVAVVALILAMLSLPSKGRISAATSLALNLLCIGMTMAVLFIPPQSHSQPQASGN